MRARRALAIVFAGSGLTAALLGACSYESTAIFPGDVEAGTPTPPNDGRPPLDVPTLPPRIIPGNPPDHCRDFVKSADESDVDCGGAECAPCAPAQACTAPSDCFSKICTDGACAQAELDGMKNGAESDVDCGGEAYTPTCADGLRCKRNSDCTSGVCRDRVCQAPSATDGIQNGSESDVDCGGLNGAVPRCAPGKTCTAAGDCDGAGAGCAIVQVEPPIRVCAPASATNNVLDNGESAVDCGGADALTPRCATGKTCAAATDCYSSVCSGANTCLPPTGVDGVKNGNESDVDCGKATTGAGLCPIGKACRTRADCVAGNCGLDGLCTLDASCAQHAGGDTCGPGERALGPLDGGALPDAGADAGGGDAHESCCAEAALPSGAVVDKYLITAGRMRSMVDALNGNIAKFITDNPPAWWNAEWTQHLPYIRAGADYLLGPWYFNEGCHLRYGGARTYDTDTDFTYGNGQDDVSSIPREVLDEKALNCVPLPLAAALCAFDGKRLATFAVLDEARKMGGAFPWGNDPASAERINHDFGQGPSYTFPLAVAELTAHVSAPGRVPGGNTGAGHSDIVGNLLPWIQDANPDLRLLSSYSWTVDEGDGTPVGYLNNSSYVIGARCMR